MWSLFRCLVELISSQVARIATITKDLQLPITLEMNPFMSKKTPRKSTVRYKGPRLISDIPSDDEGDPFEEKPVPEPEGDKMENEDTEVKEHGVPEDLAVMMNDAMEVLHKFQDKIETTVGINGWSRLFEDAAVIQRKFIWSVNQLKKADLGEKMAGHLDRLSIDEDSSSQSQRSLEMK